MPNGAGAGGAAGVAGAAGAAAAIASAIKACGPIVTVDGDSFRQLLSVMDDPLVVTAEGGFFSTKYRYLTAFKGLVFYAEEKAPLPLPDGVALIRAKKMSVPDF